MMGICQSRSDSGASLGLSGKPRLGSLKENRKLFSGAWDKQRYLDDNMSLHIHMKMSQVYQNQSRGSYPPMKELHVSVEGVTELL